MEQPGIKHTDARRRYSDFMSGNVMFGSLDHLELFIGRLQLDLYRHIEDPRMVESMILQLRDKVPDYKRNLES